MGKKRKKMIKKMMMNQKKKRNNSLGNGWTPIMEKINGTLLQTML